MCIWMCGCAEYACLASRAAAAGLRVRRLRSHRGDQNTVPDCGKDCRAQPGCGVPGQQPSRHNSPAWGTGIGRTCEKMSTLRPSRFSLGSSLCSSTILPAGGGAAYASWAWGVDRHIHEYDTWAPHLPSTERADMRRSASQVTCRVDSPKPKQASRQASKKGGAGVAPLAATSWSTSLASSPASSLRRWMSSSSPLHRYCSGQRTGTTGTAARTAGAMAWRGRQAGNKGGTGVSPQTCCTGWRRPGPFGAVHARAAPPPLPASWHQGSPGGSRPCAAPSPGCACWAGSWRRHPPAAAWRRAGHARGLARGRR